MRFIWNAKLRKPTSMTAPSGLTHRFLQSRDERHVEAGDDRYQRVEVVRVKTLAAHLYPVLDQTHALLLHYVLQIEVDNVRRQSYLDH